jgi:predicted transcriptional regulator
MTASSREEEIRQDIERTREQLGDTVEALAYKADVPARLKDKVHDTKETVQVKAEEVTHQLLEDTGALQARAGEVARQVDHLIHQALSKLPPPVAARVEPLIATARQRPLPAAAVAVLALLVLRRLFRRK